MTQRSAMWTLEELSGVGPTLAKRIRALYGSDQAFRDACDRLDLDALFDVDGLSERRAFDLVQRVRAGAEAPVSRTDRARDVERRLVELISGYAQTEYGRRVIRLLQPAKSPAQAEAHARRVVADRDLVSRTDSKEVRSALARLHRWRAAEHRRLSSRIIVAENEDDELLLRERGLDRWCRIASGLEAVHAVAEYEVAVYAERDGSLPLREAQNVVCVPVDAPIMQFVPEAVLGVVEANRPTLEAMACLAKLLERPSAGARIMSEVPLGADEASGNVRSIAEATLAWALEELERRLGERSFNGTQLLAALRSGRVEGAEDVQREVMAMARQRFREETRVGVDPFTMTFPPALDDEELDRIEQRAASRGAVASFEATQESARRTESVLEQAREELSEWFRFDVRFALASFAQAFDARPAKTSQRLNVVDARNPLLAATRPVDPVSYELGDAHSVALLTGANSGGKSSLLELLNVFALLHRCGLPVPCSEAEIPFFDEVVHLAATRGADAGALETFLGELFPSVGRDARQLVLLDEVESITELEAAGRILGVYLEEVARADGLCVLVTHLATQVLESTKAAVRVDGIDAVGLDEDFNLVVDRQPKLNHRARSTPELILQRVHARASGATKELYAKVLARLRPATSGL